MRKRGGESELHNGCFGMQTDANGLLPMRVRFYNPYLRRFVNADPSGMGGGLNRYAYGAGQEGLGIQLRLPASTGNLGGALKPFP